MLLVIESASKIRRSMLVVLDPMEPHPVACSHDLRLAGPLLGGNMGQAIFSTASNTTWSLCNSFCESSDFLNRFTQLLWGKGHGTEVIV